MPAAREGHSSKTALMVALVLGGMVIIVIVAIALVATGVIGTSKPGAPSTPAIRPTTPGPPVADTSGSPVTGTITDAKAGLSYAQLGGKWESARPVTTDSPLGRLGFTRGSIATVQENYNGAGSKYFASVYSGQIPSGVGANDLEKAATTMFTTLLPTSYPPLSTRQDVESKPYRVSGAKAWYYKIQLSFPMARKNAWNFSKETVVIITVDRGSGRRPAVFYVSVPNSHQHQGDLDLLVQSLKTR